MVQRRRLGVRRKVMTSKKRLPRKGEKWDPRIHLNRRKTPPLQIVRVRKIPESSPFSIENLRFFQPSKSRRPSGAQKGFNRLFTGFGRYGVVEGYIDLISPHRGKMVLKYVDRRAKPYRYGALKPRRRSVRRKMR
jgi:hypothetical protein